MIILEFRSVNIWSYMPVHARQDATSIGTRVKVDDHHSVAVPISEHNIVPIDVIVNQVEIVEMFQTSLNLLDTSSYVNMSTVPESVVQRLIILLKS